MRRQDNRRAVNALITARQQVAARPRRGRRRARGSPSRPRPRCVPGRDRSAGRTDQVPGVCDAPPRTAGGGESEGTPRMHHLPAAGLAAVAVALPIAGAELAGNAGRLGAVLLLQLALVGSWVLATGVGGALGTAVVGGLAPGGGALPPQPPPPPPVGGVVAGGGPG